MNVGRIVRVVGPVLDVEFAPDAMPAIYNALKIEGETPIGQVNVVAEVAQHLEGNRVRAVAMSSTDGISRGMEAVDTGKAMQMPVGPSTMGRIFNVLGEIVGPSWTVMFSGPNVPSPLPKRTRREPSSTPV